MCDLDIDDLSVRDDAPFIPEYYRDKVIFVTGFSGFIGKLLVEKLLWSCPDIKLIYVLMRSKKGMSAQDRIHKIIQLQIFDRLRERGTPFSNKLVCLEGDTCLPELGLSEEDKQKLMNVNLIFHAAASVKFDDPLVKAFEINAKGSKNILDLAVKMNSLECFLLVSTAYVNCHLGREEIKEKLYPLPFDWRQTIKDFETFDPALVATFSYKYMDGMPNTYVFTKRIAEHIVADYSDKIPSCIVRPTIVVAPAEEPVVGWVDNINGPVGLMIGHASGLIRYSLVDDQVRPDFIPADILVKYMIVLSWITSYRKEPKKLDVFNAGAKDVSFTIKEVTDIGCRQLVKYPMKKAIWATKFNYCVSKFWFTVNCFLYHIIPAIFLDGLLKITGNKPMLWKMQIRIYVAIMALSHFTTNVFTFGNEKLFKANCLIRREDVEDFFYYKDVADPGIFFSAGLRITLKNLFGQKDEDLDFARRKMKLLVFLDSTIKTIFYGYVIWKIYLFNLHIGIPKFIYNSVMHFIVGF